MNNSMCVCKKNILLLIPRYETYDGGGKYVIPMGIMYVSAYLKRADIANVYTLNMNHHEGSEEDMLRHYFKRHHINVLGLGGLSGEFADIDRIVRLSKKIDTGIKVIVGGGIMTADPETTMRAMPYCDYGVIGEGEETIVELLSAMNSGLSFENVAGLIYRVGEELNKTERRREIGDLDSLPLPDYEGFDYGKYLETNPDISDDGMSYSQVSVIGGRSCKYNCTFCFHPSGTTYRQRSLDSIFAEISYLVANYDISYIALREELFATDNRRVEEFCRRIAAYDFVWSIQLRIDSINRKLVEILKSTRCRYVFVGIESAHNDILRSMHKGITLEQIETALALLAESGIKSRSGIIFGDRRETAQTATWTVNWYLRNKDRFRMFLDMIIAFPGSRLYIDACKNGAIPDPVQFLKDGCPIVNLSGMSREEFGSLVKRIENENHRKYNVKYY
jgi:radical SAM superfamily enzyme YgiQ (UPF0313 family)